MTEFSKAFRAARASGKKVFSWNGKSYTTKLKAKADPRKSPSSQGATSGPPSDKLQKAVDSATGKAKAAEAAKTPAKPAPQQGPQPAKAVGIAKANSPIARAAAQIANAPVTPKKYDGPGTSPRMAKNTAPSTPAAPEKQGPTPEGVWYARKGSAISTAAARRANAPKVRAALAGKKS
ncbi:hypothetical protein HFN51_04340 [Rhizobium leguminosarum]|nr:hypothetical protein [Rhizobium leguminosarum]